ncbi:MAG TPA: PilW family protein [Burkholderiales bacterium]|nr:PilW family protein [Burkholderiales bacterium]
MTSRPATPRSRRAGSRGVTLVELMIAVAIGLLLVVVLAQLFLGSRQTFATTDDVSRMQDSIRFSQILMTRTIHLAGYKSQANSVTATVFKAFPALEAVDRAAPNSDDLIVRYQGSGDGAGVADGTVVDCLGAKVDAGQMITNTFKIEKNLSSGRLGLTCNGAELVPDVLNMQIMFGEDLNGDLVADRYITPDAVTVAGNMSNVVSVRVALLFETPTETSKAVADATVYDMLGNNVEKLGPFADRRIRRLVVTTINLRNRTP